MKPNTENEFAGKVHVKSFGLGFLQAGSVPSSPRRDRLIEEVRPGENESSAYSRCRELRSRPVWKK